MRVPPAVLPAALALALAGCAPGGSGGDFEGEEQQVAEAIEDLQVAASRQQNAGEVCREHFSRELVRRLESGGTSCVEEVRLAIGDTDLFDLQVEDVSIAGTSAEAQVRTTAGDRATSAALRLVQEQGDWRLDAIETTGSG